MGSLKKKLERRASEIHGAGLFSTIAIKKGAVLGTCSVRKTQEPGLHTLWLDDGDRLVDVKCRLKYINHSKKPNVAYLDDLRVVALRKIRPGDELLHDYGDAWD